MPKSFRDIREGRTSFNPAPYQTELASILRTTEKNAVARAQNMGLTPVCSRCGGTGHYSFNLKDGTICYGCGGAGYIPPKNAQQYQDTIEAAKHVAASGKLQAYLDAIADRKRAKKISDDFMAIWKSSGVNDYNWNRAVDIKRRQGTNPDWSECPIEDIRTVFLSTINAYYAHVSWFIDAAVSIDTSLRAKMTSADEKMAETNEFTAFLDMLMHFESTQLRPFVHRVDTLVADAKRGHPFPARLGRADVIVEMWPVQYLQFPDLHAAPFVRRTAGNPGWKEGRNLLWPHEMYR